MARGNSASQEFGRHPAPICPAGRNISDGATSYYCLKKRPPTGATSLEHEWCRTARRNVTKKRCFRVQLLAALPKMALRNARLSRRARFRRGRKIASPPWRCLLRMARRDRGHWVTFQRPLARPPTSERRNAKTRSAALDSSNCNKSCCFGCLAHRDKLRLLHNLAYPLKKMKSFGLLCVTQAV